MMPTATAVTGEENSMARGRRKRVANRERRKSGKREIAKNKLARRLAHELTDEEYASRSEEFVQKAGEFIQQAEEFAEQDTARRAALESDPVFHDETSKLQKLFQTAYSFNPEPITNFLERFRWPPFFNFQEALTQIAHLPSGVQELLKLYIRYASRFGVYFIHRNGGFDWRIVPTIGWKFYVEQSDGRLKASLPVRPNEVAEHVYAARQLELPAQVQTLVDSKELKYVKVKDVDGSSVLNDLESFAYHQDGVALILHEAEREYLYCLFGENTNKELLDRVGKAVTEFQRNYYGREKRGRPPDLELRKKAEALLKEPGPKKDKAANLMPTSNIASAQSRLSRISKKSE